MRLVHARVEALDVPGSFTPGRPTRCRMRLLITAGAVPHKPQVDYLTVDYTVTSSDGLTAAPRYQLGEELTVLFAREGEYLGIAGFQPGQVPRPVTR